ncbi:MAG TPA: PSD1 and planctomycete cytochrome C domain-containing protein, partial [Tepidisphaeraceae bacterium]|nr:PSD1 and planctomycete cytochrome C domain-containing protein [Tepidisphaeraceae bacterium]
MLRRAATNSMVLIAMVMGGPAIAAGNDPAGVEFFESRVRPVLVENCYACHSAESKKLKAKLRLDIRDGFFKGGESGEPTIVAGKPDDSMLITAIRQEDELKMPPKKKLANQQIKDIEAWVKMGAPYPEHAAPVATTAPSPSGPHRMTLEEGRQFWSFKKPVEPNVPETKDASWAKNDIDRFVLAKLQENGLAPSPRADKRTLIRRATYDLTGLPPSPAEIEAFEADHSSDAYPKLIDRLLASPRYGERWARHWLDVARYADTKGYVFEEERRYAYSYTYRDWVVRAFNEDLPYDQFLIQQIAADRLDLSRDKRPLAALGFLTLGRRFINNQNDIIDDRIDVVTRGTMGLTVACARCHDHKYDPIPTADYYSLYGVFASSREPKEAPLIGVCKDAALKADFEKQLAGAQKGVDDYCAAKRDQIVANLKSPKTIASSLLAAQELLGADDSKAAEIGKKHGVNAWIVQRWRDHLNAAAKKNEATFALWREYVKHSQCAWPVGAALASSIVVVPSDLKAPKSLEQLAHRYGLVLSHADLKDLPINLTVAEGKLLFNGDDELQLGRLEQKVAAVIANHPGAPPRAPAMEDVESPVTPTIFKRGNPGNPGDQVPRRFLAILSPGDRQPFKNGSGRLELAQSIASKDNPLTARVMVNRVWQGHFGFGLVRTPSDFGSRGERPTHPELLDYLAVKFMRDGWSIKKLHRVIMLSATYQQSSHDAEAGHAKDPENRLLWRMNPRRLDFESLRDSLLVASGQIDYAMGGHSVDILAQPFVPRRSIYAFIDRQNLPGMFRTFDFASPDATIGQRFTTSVPQQALFMMNSPFVLEQAKKLASRIEDTTNDPLVRVAELYRIALGREPAKDEVDLGMKFVQAELSQPQQLAVAKQSSWTYGYGEFDEAAGRVLSFYALPHFKDNWWRGSGKWPDDKLGWAMLSADGGHVGNDVKHAVIRR